MQIVTSAVRVFLFELPLSSVSLSLSVSFSTKDVGQSTPSECRDAGTAQPPWTSQTATLCTLLRVGALCGIAVISPRKARFDRARVRCLSSCKFGWYGSNPSSTLQCVGGYQPVLWPSCGSCTEKLTQKRTARLADDVWSKYCSMGTPSCSCRVSWPRDFDRDTLFMLSSWVLSLCSVLYLCGRRSACPSHVF